MSGPLGSMRHARTSHGSEATTAAGPSSRCSTKPSSSIGRGSSTGQGSRVGSPVPGLRTRGALFRRNARERSGSPRVPSLRRRHDRRLLVQATRPQSFLREPSRGWRRRSLSMRCCQESRSGSGSARSRGNCDGWCWATTAACADLLRVFIDALLRWLRTHVVELGNIRTGPLAEAGFGPVDVGTTKSSSGIVRPDDARRCHDPPRSPQRVCRDGRHGIPRMHGGTDYVLRRRRPVASRGPWAVLCGHRAQPLASEFPGPSPCPPRDGFLSGGADISRSRKIVISGP